jgi:hypothetical protein
MQKTALVVDDGQPLPTQQPAAPQSPIEMYLLGATVAIIVAIARVGIIILRKRP